MPHSDNQPEDASQVAGKLAATLESRGCEYAIGGAIALGFWAEPRGTLDVDVTLFLPPKATNDCLTLLSEIGCQFDLSATEVLLNEHSYCQVMFRGRRLDVFLPTIPFYEEAKQRRRQIEINGRPILIWDAETLCVFKMMFFRRKDLADVEQILRHQGNSLDRNWIAAKITNLYGKRDPRVAQWKELESETTDWDKSRRATD